MTVGQDKPLSRRERRAGGRDGETTAETPLTPSDDRESTESTAVTPENDEAAPGEQRSGSGGRRVRWDPAAGTPLGAATTPTDDAEGAPDSAADTDTDADAPTRAERRRSSFAPAFSSTPTPGTPDADAQATDSQATPSADAADTVHEGGSERTMTRRELRILRARAEAAGQPAPDVVFLPNGETTVTGAIDILDVDESTPPTEAHEPRQDDVGTAGDSVAVEVTTEEVAPADEARADDAPARDDSADEHPIQVVVLEDDVTDVAPEPSEPEIPALVEPEPDGTTRFPGDVPAELPPEIVLEVAPTGGAAVETPPPADGDHTDHTDDAGRGSTPGEPSAASASPRPDGGADSSDPAPGTLRPFDALFLPPSMQQGTSSTDDAAIDTSSAQLPDDTVGLRGDILTGTAKPFGHWSTQEDDDASETSLSRDVSAGAGAVTTHALVLPSIPDSSEPLLSPLTSTGEIMVTGTIDLPRSYGSTGAHPALFDHPDVDALIDDTDRDNTDTGTAPVRATRAVSSTTTTRSMIGAEPAKKSRVLPIIAVSLGGAVFIAAVSWLIASVFFTQF